MFSKSVLSSLKDVLDRSLNQESEYEEYESWCKTNGRSPKHITTNREHPYAMTSYLKMLVENELEEKIDREKRPLGHKLNMDYWKFVEELERYFVRSGFKCDLGPASQHHKFGGNILSLVLSVFSLDQQHGSRTVAMEDICGNSKALKATISWGANGIDIKLAGFTPCGNEDDAALYLENCQGKFRLMCFSDAKEGEEATHDVSFQPVAVH